LHGSPQVAAAAQRGWAALVFERLAIVSLAVIAFAAADAIGGNGFIAAFVAGLAVGTVLGDAVDAMFEFAEEEGQLVNLIVFILFGAVAWHLLGDVTWQMAVCAALSLTLVRLLPVALCLARSGLRARTVLFMGWFGPRGLASIAYGLFILEEEPGLGGVREIVVVMTVTVVMSVIAHGATAAPVSARYARWSASLPEAALELTPATEQRPRIPFGGRAAARRASASSSDGDRHPETEAGASVDR
jgi:NhaP-type Na+/H+ or K+/H+ antiporter